MALFKPYCRTLRSLKPQTLWRGFSCSTTRLAEEVRIVEVGPRDGLQNEKNSISLSTKLELIRRLARTGVHNMEAGSFVAPKWVPQMANSADVLNHILEQPPPAPSQVAYNFLVPNLKGLENFLKARNESLPSRAGTGSNAYPKHTPLPHFHAAEDPSPSSTHGWHQISLQSSDVNEERSPVASSLPTNSTEISVFTAATEAFSKANTNCSISQSLERCKPIISLAKSQNIRVRGYVSVALGCPYEGHNVSPSKVAEITATLLEAGVDEVSVADTTGMGTASRTHELLKELASWGIAFKDLALHFHDTYGQALVNATVGLERGIRTFDSSVGGLGGCPYSKGATGNLATEDLVYWLHSLGASTSIDLEETAKIGAWISAELGRTYDSRAGKAIVARLSS